MKLSHSNRNQGALLLAKSGKTQAEIAARVEVSRSVVAYWLAGERVPRLDSRAVLRKQFGIPIESWDKPIERNPIAKKAASKASRKIEADAPELAATAVQQGETSIRAKAMKLDGMVHDLLARVRDDKDTSDLEKFKCMNSAAATLNLLGKLTGQTQEVNEARILRLPAFQRIQEALIRRLSPWPDALREVGEELQRMGGEN